MDPYRANGMSNGNSPFKAGDRVRPSELLGWACTGLTGKPDVDPKAVRRYRKGDWVLELTAYNDWRIAARVVSCRTVQEDQQWWRNARTRRRNPPKP